MWNYPFTLHMRLNTGCKIGCQHLDVSCAPIYCVCTNRIVPLDYCQTTREFQFYLNNQSHNQWGKRHYNPWILLLNALFQDMDDMPTNIYLFMGKEIIQKSCPWSWQCSEVGDQIQVVNHHICQSPHLWWEWYCVYGWLFRCATKCPYQLISRPQSIFILHCNRLWGRTNL